MPKSSYHEGWGYTDTIKLIAKGTTTNRNNFFKEFKKTYPKDQVEKSGKEYVEVYVYESQIPLVKRMAKIFDLKITYGEGGGTGGQEIARTILAQLGGQGKLVVMTGAYNFIALKNGVSFKLKSRKANYVKITLNGKDLYDIEFQKIIGTKAKIIAEHNDIYFDQLIPIVEKETGMYLKLFKKGGFVSTQNRDMVLSQLKSIHHHEEELKSALKTSPEIEAWVLAKVQRATTDLADVTHFVDGKTEYAKGGLVAYINGNYDKKIANFSSLLEAKKFAKANKWKYDTIIFEDEIGDNIIVEKSDTFKDIDWLFSDKYDTGGKTPEFIDLFEDYENIPPKVQKILDKYEESFEDGDYQGLNKAHAELGKIGYTFEFYLDGVAYGLRPENIELNQLKGYEEFAEGGVAQGFSVADANPYIAGAKAVQGIAPQSVSAIDKTLASKLYRDPNRPVFFAVGGKVGDYIRFKGYDETERVGAITEDLGNGVFAVSSGFGQVLVNEDNYLGQAEAPVERKKFLGIFANGGEIYSHKHSRKWGEDIKIELLDETKKGWKVRQTTIKGRSNKSKVAYFTASEIAELFEKI